MDAAFGIDNDEGLCRSMRNWANFWPHAVTSLTAASSAITQVVTFNWPYSKIEHATLWPFVALSAVFAALAIRDLRPVDPGYSEVSFKYPRGVNASSTSDAIVSDKKKARIREVNAQIRAWMLHELDMAGGATIYTRNLSWAFASDPVFAEKAHSIRIVSCGKMPPIGRDLEHLRAFHDLGCEIYFLKTDFEIRFTQFVKSGKKYYAIGLPEGRRHTIRTPTRTDDWAHQFIAGFHRVSQQPRRSRLFVTEKAS